jgi:hypothetical protein
MKFCGGESVGMGRERNDWGLGKAWGIDCARLSGSHLRLRDSDGTGLSGPHPPRPKRQTPPDLPFARGGKFCKGGRGRCLVSLGWN